jgi:signal transduction histidine kinase
VSSFKALKDLTSPPYRVSFEQKVKSAQGWRWVAWSNSAIFENDEVVGFIGIGREVTKRKRSELALENNQRKLQEQNDEYLALNEEYQALNEELHNTNNELLNAIEKAQESERLKTAFLQNMSHEIRTPLNAVIGFSEMMSLTGFSDEERDEFAEIVVNNSRQLLSLVDDIMTISTIETQQNKLSESRLHVSSLLSELHAVFAGNLKAGVDLKILLPEGDQSGFTIIADEMKLRQIFNNLIGNALKFTHEGSISFGYDLNQESSIRFFVKDTGIGILPEVQDKIFERFRQAGENIQKRYGGTGLGLAISKGQVDLMGGRIWVESEIGKGSVFYFEIPLHQPEA